MIDYERIRRETDLEALFAGYGLSVGRNGLCLCPFHRDRRPSMKLYPDHYHCYSCGAHGDAVSLVAHMENLSPKEAAEKLGYGALDPKGAGELHRRLQKRRREEARKKSLLERAVSGVEERLRAYRRAMEEHPPKLESPEVHPDFLEAVHSLPRYEYFYELLTSGDPLDAAEAFQYEEVKALVQ